MTFLIRYNIKDKLGEEFVEVGTKIGEANTEVSEKYGAKPIFTMSTGFFNVRVHVDNEKEKYIPDIRKVYQEKLGEGTEIVEDEGLIRLIMQDFGNIN